MMSREQAAEHQSRKDKVREWSKTTEHGRAMMDDPFATIRTLTGQRDDVDWAWRTEVMNLRAAGFSTRAIAQVAGVSHDTVWKVR